MTMRGDVRNPSLPTHIAGDGEINKWGERRRMDPLEKLATDLIDAHIEAARNEATVQLNAGHVRARGV